MNSSFQDPVIIWNPNLDGGLYVSHNAIKEGRILKHNKANITESRGVLLCINTMNLSQSGLNHTPVKSQIKMIKTHDTTMRALSGNLKKQSK